MCSVISNVQAIYNFSPIFIPFFTFSFTTTFSFYITRHHSYLYVDQVSWDFLSLKTPYNMTPYHLIAECVRSLQMWRQYGKNIVLAFKLLTDHLWPLETPVGNHSTTHINL